MQARKQDLTSGPSGHALSRWYGANDGSSEEGSLAEFIAAFNSSSGAKPTADFAFVFDANRNAKALQADWKVPPPMAFAMPAGQKIFSVGDHDTGLQFHSTCNGHPITHAILLNFHTELCLMR